MSAGSSFNPLGGFVEGASLPFAMVFFFLAFFDFEAAGHNVASVSFILGQRVAFELVIAVCTYLWATAAPLPKLSHSTLWA